MCELQRRLDAAVILARFHPRTAGSAPRAPAGSHRSIRSTPCRLSWALPEGIDGEGPELLLFQASQTLGGKCLIASYVEKELRRCGVTRVLLWADYRRQSRRLWLYLVLRA